MHNALTDFRVESDNLILLRFQNGKSYRVNAHDLSEYLTEEDARRVREALALRRGFIKRVLPPTLVALLVGSIIVVGNVDLHRFAHRTPGAGGQKTTPTVQSVQVPSSQASAPPPAASQGQAANASTGSSDAASTAQTVSAPSMKAIHSAVPPIQRPSIIESSGALQGAENALDDTIKDAPRPLHALP